ncbi:hypothetical protein IB245_13040 [Pseudomonas sp. PDM02]|uniref:hypothetical protein n=1 Tax=Pseudomonas sp. PDM02 TaxID=2769267 RepID=UPI00178179C6|nr:hypothetical protein [Pseudomonas sp. PDM02]MBD9612425.1 hypothetical protein [Pseudomonas sp. PDM02]
MFENYDTRTGTTVYPPTPFASGSLEATIETHPDFKSSRVSFRASSNLTFEIYATNDEFPDKRGWSFRFDYNIKAGKYFINDNAVKKVWYTRQIPGQPPGNDNVYLPAKVIGTVTIKEIDLTKGRFNADFDFSVIHIVENKIFKTEGKIDVWDMEKIPSDSN